MADIDAFLEELSSARPVPGGGSVAALQTAMGAALLVMVTNLTLGKKRYLEVQDQVTRIRERAETLRDWARSLAQMDADAYGQVSQTLSLPRGTEQEKAERLARLQAALKGAVGPPLETMRAASAVAGLAEELAGIGNRNAISDVGSGVLAARAGFHAAQLNVEINLASIGDAAWVDEVRDAVRAIPVPDQTEARVLEQVLRAIREPAG